MSYGSRNFLLGMKMYFTPFPRNILLCDDYVVFLAHVLIFVQNGMTAIHVAALFGQTEVVQEFMSRAPKSVLLVSEVREAFVF